MVITHFLENKFNESKYHAAQKLYNEILRFHGNVKRAFHANKVLIVNKVGPEILIFIEEEINSGDELRLEYRNVEVAYQKNPEVFPEELSKFQKKAQEYKNKITAILFFTKFYSRDVTTQNYKINVTLNPLMYQAPFIVLYRPLIAKRKKTDDINKEINIALNDLADRERKLGEFIDYFPKHMQESKIVIIKDFIKHIKQEAVWLYDKDKRKKVYDEFEEIKKMTTVEEIMSSGITKYLEPLSLLKPLLQEFPDTFIEMIRLLLKYYEIHQEMGNLAAECKEFQNKLDAAEKLKESQNKLNSDISNIKKAFTDIINSFPKLDAEMEKKKSIVIRNLLTYIENKPIMLYSENLRQINAKYAGIEKIKNMSTIETILGSGRIKYLEPSLLYPLLEEFPNQFMDIIKILLDYYKIHQEMKNTEAECRKVDITFASKITKFDIERPNLLKILLNMKKVIASNLTDDEKKEIEKFNNARGSIKNFRESIEPQKGPR